MPKHILAAVHAQGHREPNPITLHDALSYCQGFDMDDFGPSALSYVRHW